jgi:hypothetical protein
MTKPIKKIMISADLFESLMNLFAKATHKHNSYEEINNFINHIKLSIEEIE